MPKNLNMVFCAFSSWVVFYFIFIENHYSFFFFLLMLMNLNINILKIEIINHKLELQKGYSFNQNKREIFLRNGQSVHDPNITLT